MVYWVAAAQILFYLSAIPLQLVFCLKAGNDIRFGAGMGLFEMRFARRRALSNMDQPKKKRRMPFFSNLPKSGKLLWRFFKEIDIREFTIRGQLSLGDAASTALLCGSLPAFEHALRPFLPGIRLRIQPCFNSSNMHIDLQGMISLKTGQIMLAVITSAFNYVNGRIAQWTDTPSKAS